jgi:hypothetical protein
MLFTVDIAVSFVSLNLENVNEQKPVYFLYLRSKTTWHRAAIDKKSSNTMDLGVQKRSCDSCILLASFSTSKTSLIYILFPFSYHCTPFLYVYILADWMLFVLPVANQRHYVCWHVHMT